jgi:hypothetical protein
MTEADALAELTRLDGEFGQMSRANAGISKICSICAP